MAGQDTAYTIVPITEATREAFHQVDQAAFFFDETQETDEALESLDLSRCFAATPTGAAPFAGVYGSYDMTLTIPAPGGGLQAVPMAGLTWVGVHPDERRRGVMSQMVRHHFHEVRRQGAALSGLHASEPAIYGRFGYGVASLDAYLGLSRGDTLRAPALDAAAADVRTRVVALAGEGVAERVHRMHVELSGSLMGAVARTERQARALSRDFLPARRGSEPTQVLLAERDGEDVGYALFRRSSKWEEGRPQGALSAREMMAADSGALLALTRRLLDFDLTTSVTLKGRSLDDPVLWWAGGPRGASVKIYDGTWLRLVEVGAALAQRGMPHRSTSSSRSTTRSAPGTRDAGGCAVTARQGRVLRAHGGHRRGAASRAGAGLGLLRAADDRRPAGRGHGGGGPARLRGRSVGGDGHAPPACRLDPLLAGPAS